MKNTLKRLFFKNPKPDVILVVQRGTQVKVDRIGALVIISTETKPIETICRDGYRAYFE